MTLPTERCPPSASADKAFRDDLLAIIPQLRSFARGLCGNRDLADDLAQDAMTRAWAARSSYQPGTNFRAWIFMILRNQFYTTIRKNSRMVSWDPEIAERLLVVDASQQDGLNVEDVAREVLMLIGANGLSYEEAAEVMGCAIGTIKSRLARGRVALSALINGPAELGDDGINDQDGLNLSKAGVPRGHTAMI